MKLHLIYFSAAGTTKRIIEAIAEGIISQNKDFETIHYPLIKMNSSETVIDKDDLTLFAIPVYAGRVPAIAVEQINKFQTKGARAILVAVYGNREYDDALLELRDIVTANGFTAIAAGTFIAEHSIFPKVAADRPNEADLQQAREFGAKACEIVPNSGDAELNVPGNNPYKTPGSIPIKPKTVKGKCIKSVKKDKDACGICAAVCPVGAIGSPKPKTNSDICIKCAHCIAACPHDARVWGGILYKIAEKKFVENYSEPQKVPAFFYL